MHKIVRSIHRFLHWPKAPAIYPLLASVPMHSSRPVSLGNDDSQLHDNMSWKKTIASTYS